MNDLGPWAGIAGDLPQSSMEVDARDDFLEFDQKDSVGTTPPGSEGRGVRRSCLSEWMHQLVLSILLLQLIS